LQIIQLNLFIVIVSTIAEGVNGCDLTAGSILFNCRYTPSVIGIPCDCFSVLVNDSNYVTLQVLDEVVGNVIVENTANPVLVIVERDKRIAVPSLTKNLGTVESIFVLDTVYNFRGTNTICVVSIGISVEALELSTFLPSQSVTEIVEGVTLNIIFDRLAIKAGEQILPSCISVGVSLSSYLNILIGAFCFSSN
jgi:hypothetical protein